MTTWQMLVLAWGVGAPLAVVGFALAYPAYLRVRRRGLFTRRPSAVHTPRAAMLRRI